MSKNALADQLEVWGVENDYTLFTDGSIGFAFDLKPIDVSSHSDDSINQFAEQTKTFLNSLPPGIDVQFVQDIKAGNNKVITDYEKLAVDAENEIAKKLCDEKVEKFRSMDDGGLLPFHGLKLLVRRPFESSLVKTSIFRFSEKKSVDVTEDNLRKEIKLTDRIKSDIKDSLESLGLEAKELSAQELLSEVYHQWNPDRPIDFADSNPEKVRDHLLYTDVFINKKGFEMSEWHHRVISLKNLPDTTYASMARHLRHLPFDSRAFLSINVPDQAKEVESLQSQRRIAYSMSMGKTGVSDIESSSKFQDLETLLEQMIAQGEKVFHVSLNILLRSKDIDDLEDQVSQTLALFREMSGCEGLVETIASFDIFRQMALPNARSMERAKRVKTSNLADLIPIYAPWRGHDKPSLLLRSSMGSLLTFDSFDSSHTNANQLISAGSGAGKSFFTNLFILQMLKESPRVFFVDIGGSYQKLCENLDGQYVPLESF